MTKTMPWAAESAAPPLRALLLHVVARVLQAAGDAAERYAERVAVARTPAEPRGTVEYHPVYRDAGAPEGALYVDGQLVGYIAGVERL